MKKLFCLSIVLLLLLSGCKDESLRDAIKFKNEYEVLNGKKINNKVVRELSISKYNSIIYTSAKEVEEKISNNETFVIYLGFPECPWCRSVLPILLEVASDLKIDTIYYINIKDMRDSYEIVDNKLKKMKKGTKDYKILLRLFDNVIDEYTLTNDDGEEIDTLEKRIYAPSIISVVNGEVVDLTDGISDMQTDAYMKLTDDIKKSSYNKIECSIKCVSTADKLCKQSKC